MTSDNTTLSLAISLQYTYYLCLLPLDDPLAVQIFQNQLYFTSTIFITEIIGAQCRVDILAILRNTENQDFYGIDNVNHTLTSTYVAKRKL